MTRSTATSWKRPASRRSTWSRRASTGGGMAGAFLRALAGERFEVASAGTEATRVHSFAIQAMDEVGIDLAGHTSKSIDAFPDKSWDYVITVCDSANDRCPVFPGRATRIHWSFPDPSQATGTDQERLQAFRRA